MTLATVSPLHKPSARIVLLKEYDHHGFVFYTNYASRKGMELAHNPAVALLFWWEALERQVRIEGIVEKVSTAQSEQYFHSRPKSSQAASLASYQSQKMEHATDLRNRYEKLCAEYAAAESLIPLPPHWGGYRVKPTLFEYWQGRENRLHDRFQYTRDSQQNWIIDRLFP